MFWTRADGSGRPQQLTHSDRLQLPNCSTNNDKQLIFTQEVPGAGAEIRVMPIESQSGEIRAGEPQLLLKTQGVNTFASLSPNGKWLAYADAQAGRYEVYVREFVQNGDRVQVSNAGGTMPQWSRTGNYLFYRTQDDHQIMVAGYSIQGHTFVPERPRLWSAKHLANVGLSTNLDLAPNGKRFVVLMPAERPESPDSQGHVSVVVNFPNEVQSRIAARGQ
jgi:Tol biopolymer transport system component